jgi:hypothetical protein
LQKEEPRSGDMIVEKRMLKEFIFLHSSYCMQKGLLCLVVSLLCSCVVTGKKAEPRSGDMIVEKRMLKDFIFLHSGY